MNLLSAINWATVGIVAAICLGLAIVFTALILLISKLCYVKQDETVEKVSELLSGANCGGCGKAGCKDFACALVKGEVSINDCGSTPAENKRQIADILNIPFEKQQSSYAVVRCNGGTRAADKYRYVGNEGCANQSKMQGGAKLCHYGCLGGGDCAKRCPAGAITVNDNVAVVNRALCVSCRSCVLNCPKQCITMLEDNAKVYVACNSQCRGLEVTNVCKAGCIACGICARFCPNGAIEMVNNLPVINNEKCNGCLTCVTKCPRKIIKQLNKN